MCVFFAEETLELGGIAAEHLRDLFGVESYKAFCEMLSRFVVDPHRVSGGEIALHLEHAGCEQTGRSPTYRVGRARVGHQSTLRVGREANP